MIVNGRLSQWIMRKSFIGCAHCLTSHNHCQHTIYPLCFDRLPIYLTLQPTQFGTAAYHRAKVPTMPAAPINRFHNTPSNPFGPAPTPNETMIPRPKSSSSLPYARPSNPIQNNGSASQQHPIMVALSGWPEPVYVAESKEVARRRSRAGTPVLAPLTTGMGDGVDLNMLSPLNGGGRAPNKEDRHREEGSPYPLSSARSTRTSPVPSGPNSPVSSHNHHSYPNPPLPKGYHDPRYGPGAALHNRALKVVPAWSSSSSASSRQHENLGVGIRVPAGKRGEGNIIMRAVPDVYPPPGMVMAGGGLAKEVYPRDPNNVLLWGGAVPVQAIATGTSHSIDADHQHQSAADVKEESMRD